jgi:hypothetical protein
VNYKAYIDNSFDGYFAISYSCDSNVELVLVISNSEYSIALTRNAMRRKRKIYQRKSRT